MNNYLSIISEWVFQWRICFNPDPNKQANKVYFSRKAKAQGYLPVELNNCPIQSDKSLGVILDNHFNFHKYIEKKIKICNKLIDIIKDVSSSR